MPPNRSINTSALLLSSLASLPSTDAHPILTSASTPLPPVPASVPPTALIPGSRFLIDAFRHAGDFSVAYFLSHFHSDHYGGLGPSWRRGLVFCSTPTARLVSSVLSVPPQLVVALDVGVRVTVDGWGVTAVDANHCPGAVQFLFSSPGPNAERYVHTDTTYCNPKFTFPSQDESVDYVVNAIKCVKEESSAAGERVLCLIATYVVGKERILLEVARRCGCSIHVDSRKMEILTALGFGGENGVFTEDAAVTDVHVIGWNILGETWPYFRPNFVKMKEIMLERGYMKAIGSVPTGWMYETKKESFAVRVKDSLEIHLVPYSEHSSYDELRDYVKFLHPKRVIPTVGVNAGKLDSKEAIAMQKHFSGLVDETANKQEFLMAFHRRSTDAKCSIQHDGDAAALLPAITSASEQLDTLKENITEEMKKELSDFLPSWVSEEQIMDLLMSSGGDVVKAASDFFERERDFFEEANGSCSGTSKSDKNHTSDHGSSADKGWLTSSTESGGRKQSTITNYFIRATATTSRSGTADKVYVEAHQNNVESDDQLTDIVKTQDQSVDQLLQIVDGGMSREYAVSLLERAKGDVTVAVDIFYSSSENNYVIAIDKNIVLQITENETKDKCSNTDLACDSSQATPKMPNLHVQTSLSQTDPTKISLPVEKYLPIEHACWTAGQPAPYLHLARTFDLVEKEKGKIKTSAIFCNMFRSLLALSPDDVLPAVYLCTNKISPDHENMVHNLRIGAMMKTILPALAHAVVFDRKCVGDPLVSLEAIKTQLQSLSTEVAEAYNVIPNLDLLIPSLLREGTAFSASSLAMVPGTPIPPMLARITNGLSQVLKAFNGKSFTCEYKYDGQRAQIHRLFDGSVRIFSRQMKESTPRFPDVVNMITELCRPEVSSFILDAEVVGIDRKKGNKLMSFQELSSRERGNKHSSIAIDNIKAVRFLEQGSARYQRKNDGGSQRLLCFGAQSARSPPFFPAQVEASEASPDNSSTLDRMNTFFRKACESSCEGIMLKTLDVDAGYSASKRCDSWLKVKRDYVEGLGDTLDLVPVGAWYGNGRKAGWYSPFFMACYNPVTEEFQSVCRVMSGFSDEFYKEMKEFYSGERILPKKPVYYKTDEQPEVWFTTEQVWEIRGADLTLSPVHHAAIGLVHPSRGISVRMPRYIRSVPDRSPEDCRTATDIATMFKAQTRKMDVCSEGQE
ncbi:DNA cross-link repair 1 protein isoform X3 [Panicum miliaceum]|uniref:DNA cross-link repair 1 protein isoform X3 n=1 Tax=Panicum miliaceum TaxID=4540 RepID=A0A3L6SNH3_PANMI|nr:DNA cross-link repair 1 protein isoform X3 [Panicum miliaceum]